MPERVVDQRRADATPDTDGYRFLVGRYIDEETLRLACVEATRCAVAIHEVLIRRGWISASDYASALAEHLRIDRSRIEAAARLRAAGAGARNVEGSSASPPTLAAARAAAGEANPAPLLMSPELIDWGEPADVRIAQERDAALRLGERYPELSAAGRYATWQLVAAPAAVGLACGGLVVAPAETLTALTALVTFPFLVVVGLRLVSLMIVLGQRRRSMPPHGVAGSAMPERMSDADLPVYSIMVPMFREADVLPQLVDALSAIDYPTVKLDILLVLESVDEETQAAARQLELPGNVRIIVVPDGTPRTKPKALNYAFRHVRGDYVVVYDAEDEPDPGQLRQAVAAFRAGPPNLACIQARLNIYNPDQSWLTREFTIEYSALFDALLPALVRLGLPVPLGGTSNHFPVPVLQRLGGWDAFNVTEDADLGLRIARTGGRVAVLESTTWEEAPPGFRIWLPQRTRWLKGFMQTWLVHMRSPRRLLAELGPGGFVGFHAFIGGIILSTLIYPVFVVLFIADLASGQALIVPQTLSGQVLLGLELFNLVGGYVAGIATAGLAVIRRGYRGMMWSIVLMPLYWLLISLAAYRAAWQLVTKPYLWEKTPHRPRGARDRRSGPAT